MAHNKEEMTPRSSALDREKYLNALVYFVANCDNEKLGIMKLNKLFYYLDFISYRDRNKSVTGETYVHLPKGPFAAALQDDILKSARKSKLIEQKKSASEKYGERNRFQALKTPDVSVFDEYERELLGYLCATFKDWSTDQLVAQTHSEAPWVFSKPSHALSYKDADDIEFFESEQAVTA